MGSRFRLLRETTGIAALDGRKLIVHIPAGAEVLFTGPFDALRDESPDRQVIVHWNGKAILLFGCDIQERGILVEGAESAAARG